MFDTQDPRPPDERRRALPAVLAVVAVALLAVAIVVTSGQLASRSPSGDAASPSAASASAAPTRAPGSAPATAPATATPVPSGTGAALDRTVVGDDGRVTVLFLGSDARPPYPGIRTDTIMVLSLDPSSGDAAVASIPRDVAGFPLPGGRIFRPKVNALFQSYLRDTDGDVDAAGRRTADAVGAALGIEIDGYLLVGFDGVRRLVDALGGVDVTLREPVRNADGRELFPAGDNHLDGERALAFVRTRKGDDDFARSRRGQLLLVAIADALRERGLLRAPQLVAIGSDEVETDLRYDDPLALLALADRVDLAGADTVVFGPSRYAVPAGGTDYRLRLATVRAWVTKHMAPVDDR